MTDAASALEPNFIKEQACPLQVMRKNDLIRKNMVESVKNERNILAMANNPFVVGVHSLLTICTNYVLRPI